MTLTPKEYATNLRKAMFQPIFDIDSGVHTAHDKGRYLAAIKCALICVNTILERCDPFAYHYWEETKEELLKQQNNG